MTEAESAAEPTVEDALLTAAAQSLFRSADVHLGHRLAGRVEAGSALTGKQRRAAWRLLHKYKDPLREHGVDYDAITPPRDRAQEPATSAPGQVGGAQIELEIAEGRIRSRSPFRFKDLCKSIPGARWSARAKQWTYPESPTSALNVRDTLAGHAELNAPQAFWDLVSLGEEQRSAAAHKDADDLPDVPGTTTQAWDHQRRGYWFLRAQEAGYCTMAMGAGKSLVAVGLHNASEARRSVILCPPSVVDVWPREFRTHSDREVHVVTGARTDGSVAARTGVFDHAVHECACGAPHVIVANYQVTAYEPFRSWALEQSWDWLIMDEVHRIKAPDGVWSRYCAKLRDHAQRRLGLTGTPMPQGPLDVFAQVRALDPAVFGTSWTSFRGRYAVMGGYGGHEVTAYRIYPTMNRWGEAVENPNYDPEIAEEFHGKLYRIMYQVDDSVLDLPEARDVTRTCTLSAAARRTYDGVNEELYAEIDEDEAISADNVLVRLLRLQQITGGAVTLDSGEVQEIDTAKRELLADFIADLPLTEPVVVFCRFHHDLEAVRQVAERQGRRYAELSGRHQDVLNEDARMREDVDIAGVQIQSGGVGIDLSRAAYGLYFSLGFSLGDYSQSRARLVRPGQERSVLFGHLVAAGTVDEDVYDALSARAEVVDYVTARIRDRQGT